VLRAAVLAIPLPILAIELGWMVAEVGRQPWIVQGVDEDRCRSLARCFQHGRGRSLSSGILILYALLFSLWLYSLGKGDRLAARGRHRARPDAAYTPRAREASTEMPELSTVWFVLLGFLFGGYASARRLRPRRGNRPPLRRPDRRGTAPRPELHRSGLGRQRSLADHRGGALFAAFPIVYATVFSGFYLAMALVLGALILRGISIEFRSKETAVWWRRAWDFGFFLARRWRRCSSASRWATS